jgi:hypothetical protein
VNEHRAETQPSVNEPARFNRAGSFVNGGKRSSFFERSDKVVKLFECHRESPNLSLMFSKPFGMCP